MQVTRLVDAKPYTAARHFGMSALRLQGHEATHTSAFWCGLSYFRPGGGAEQGASPLERVYVVIDGEVSVSTDGGEVTLGRLDSCHIAPNETRAIVNRSNAVATMLVVMQNPPPEAPR